MMQRLLVCSLASPMAIGSTEAAMSCQCRWRGRGRKSSCIHRRGSHDASQALVPRSTPNSVKTALPKTLTRQCSTHVLQLFLLGEMSGFSSALLKASPGMSIPFCVEAYEKTHTGKEKNLCKQKQATLWYTDILC